MNHATRKVALVTGASRGIGAEAARRLARDGFHVLLNFVHGSSEASAVATDIGETGGQATLMRADISDAEAVSGIFDHAERKFGGIDILVNNAGIQTLDTLTDVSDQQFDDLVRVNLKGPFNTMREAAKRLRDGGRVINLSSGTTIVLRPRYGVYAATKAALEALSAVVAKELRGRNITVNTVLPGPVATALFLKDKTSEQLEQAAQQSPLERLGEPRDIANVIAFLAGPDGGWINGQTIVANGAFA